MLKYAVMAAAMTLAACSSAEGLHCSDALHTAAMEKLWVPLHLGSASDDRDSALTVLRETPKLREWAGGLPDRCARWAYLDWINHAERRAKEALDPAALEASKRASEQFDDERRQKDLDTLEAGKHLPDPPSP